MRVNSTIRKFLGLSILILLLTLVVIIDQQNSKTSPKVQKQIADSKYYLVTKIIDGDTIDINKDGQTQRLRLLGINTPETTGPYRKKECYGLEAKDDMERLLSNRLVSIEYDPKKKDKMDVYGRELVYVYRDDGIFINKTLIEDGSAYEYTYRGEDYTYKNEFRNSELTAKESALGLWGKCE